MKSNTWMKFYIGDYLRDTGHLSTCEHGAYVLLLFHAFTHDGVLPNDEVRLRIIAKMSAKDWNRSSHTLRAFFYVDGDTLRQRRIDRELGEISKSSEQKSVAGKASAVARAAQRKSNGNSTHVEVPLEKLPVDTESDKKRQKESERKIHGELAFAECFERFWKSYPRKIGKDAARKAAVKATRTAPWAEIIAGLQRYQFSPDPQYQPHASTWLNEGRWKIEPDTPPPFVLTPPPIDPTFSPGML